MPNLIIAVNKKLRIPVLADSVDGYLNETHVVRIQKNDVPIENGSPITDHATVKPDQLSCTGVVIDKGYGATPEQAWTRLREVQRSLVPVKVFTWIAVYDAMLITSIKANRVGDGFKFDMSLETVLLAAVQEAVLNQGDGPASGRDGNLERGRVDTRAVFPAPTTILIGGNSGFSLDSTQGRLGITQEAYADKLLNPS